MKALLLAAISTAAVAVIAGFLYFTREPSLRGSVINPPLPAAEVDLTDFAGRQFSLKGSKGDVVLLYFGYTNCPDECPLTMAHLKLAIGQLGARSARTRVVMITTDPGRDTAAALGAFLGRFDSDFLGLTGTPDQLGRVWKDYGVTVLGSGETHSNYIYVIDTSGDLVETLLPESQPADIAADVQTLLERR